jgi:hypothetical protein
LGIKPEEGKLNVTESSQTTVVASSTIAEALARGGLGMGDLANGRNYTVVWVGARAGLASGSWWMPFTLVMVRSDP